jgi:flagellar M-ring protein FliF
MEYLKQIATHLAEIVRRMSVSQVVMLMAIIIGVIVGVVTVAGWLGKITYQPLYSNLEPAEAADITRYLAEKNISYQLSAGGTTIEVPESDLYESRISLASEGLPNSGSVGYSIFDESNLGMTDFLQKLNFRRALEGELSRTITALNEVQAARVHIVIPEERLFTEQQKEATASVVLKLKHIGGLSKSQVNGITHLVASSVEGLRPNNITIVDYHGNMLSNNSGHDELAAMTGTQIEMTRQIERDLENKAQSMLDGVLGPGKGIVRVTAELNFQQVTRTSENYDPDQVAIVSEQRTEGVNSASEKSGEKNENQQNDRSEVTVTNYEVSKTVESVQNAIGTIDRLSVAVLLDGTYRTIENVDGAPEMIYEPRPQEEIDRLAAIVKNAVGFSDDRSDQIEIVNIAFDKTYLTEQQQSLDQQYSREFYYEIVKKVIIALVVLLVLLYLRKRLKNFFAGLSRIIPPAPRPTQASYTHSTPPKSPATAEKHEAEPEPAEMMPEQRQPKLVDRMQRVAKDEPEEIAKVIKTIMVD